MSWVRAALALAVLAAAFSLETTTSSPAIVRKTGRQDAGIVETRFCEYYNETACPHNASDCKREQCTQSDEDNRNHCFVLWHIDNATQKTTVKLKGCFTDSKQCHDRTECTDESWLPNKGLLFCCCDGDMCNNNFTWNPLPTEPPDVKLKPQPNNDGNPYILIGFISIALILILIFIFYFCLKRQKSANLFNELPTAEPSLSCPPSPEGLEEKYPLSITLKEVRARGRFGAVWRACLNSQEIAVKIFPVQDKQSWISEQEIFKLPRMNHPDILHFIDVEKRGDNLQAEYWLITDYHEKGSLCDYLKANTITWEEACNIAFTMARGLTHLHEEISASHGGEARKPAVAHRDFKSKNVLLKHDMSACIADFGLALIFHPGKPCGDTHGQVGTRRYMAPEVLEGAINFTRDAFLRIDMYACGLVLWEIASRCTACGIPNEYMLPLEEEVGAHPSLEEMQESVAHRKLRPKIPEIWREHNTLYTFCDTMEECWDHDAEARLSASCVMERIGALSRCVSASRMPLLIENALPLPPHSNREV